MLEIGKFELNQAINQYLQINGIKQTFVAEKIGLKISMLNAILHNKRVMTANEYILICKALNVDLNLFNPLKAI